MTTRQVMVMSALAIASLVLSNSVGARQPLADEWLAKPVDERTFKTYLDFFTYDRRAPFDLRVIGTDEQEGIKREHLSFQSTPGERVFAHLYSPPGADPKRSGALILLHGGAAGGKNGLAPVARNFARAGWMVLAIDMKYYGERATDLLTTFTEQEKADRLYNQPPVYLTWMTQTVKDLGRAFDVLVDQRGVDAKRIGLVGFSRGGIVATIAGAVERRLAAIVISYGGHFTMFERGHLPAACPANYIGRISPRPVLLLNGLYDETMVKEMSVEPLYRLAKQPKQILWSEGGARRPFRAESGAHAAVAARESETTNGSMTQ